MGTPAKCNLRRSMLFISCLDQTGTMIYENIRISLCILLSEAFLLNFNYYAPAENSDRRTSLQSDYVSK